MKTAIVHDFLMQMGGAEKVVEVLHEMYPDAPVYTSAYDAQAMPARYRQWDIRTSFIQKLWMKQKTHRLAVLLYPMAFESFDLSDYDLILSSSSAFAKGVITQPHTTHICYKHTPMRYAWSTRDYMQNEKMGVALRSLLVPATHYLRLWDSISASRVDRYVANSTIVSQRIRKFYGRDSDLVYPPVDISRFSISPVVDDYYVVVSRFVPYKRLDLAVDAFTKMGKPLKVIGCGRQMNELRARAGKNVQFLGRVDDETTAHTMARARGFIMPGEEDFGIAPVEANACGRPVIAFAAGGALDTQTDGVTGVLFAQQTVEALCAAVQRAETISWDSEAIRANAQRFETAVFRRNMETVIERALNRKKRDNKVEQTHERHDLDLARIAASAENGASHAKKTRTEVQSDENATAEIVSDDDFDALSHNLLAGSRNGQH